MKILLIFIFGPPLAIGAVAIILAVASVLFDIILTLLDDWRIL